MICSKCGLATLEGFRFCPKCGMRLDRPPVKIDRSKLKGPRDAYMKVIQGRESIDKAVPPLWIWVMLFIYLFWLISSIVIAFSVAIDALNENPSDPDMELLFDEMKRNMSVPIVFGFFFYFLTAALGYTIISRMNNHYDRDRNVRAASVSLISAGTSTPASKVEVGGELFAMNRTDELISSEEKKRNPIFWALLLALPLLISVLQYATMFNSDSYSHYQRISPLFSLAMFLTYLPILYISYSLSKSVFEHHRQWADFANQTTAAVNELDMGAMDGYWGGTVPSRPYVVYVIVTGITFGLFMFYWWYTIIKDLNQHFVAHRDFEDNLARSISQ